VTTLTPDERAAIRAYLQRSEVRLSTLHRVATALLSGAGLIVLLPAIGRDAVVTVIRSLATGDLDATHVALLVGVAAVLVLPLMALWLFLSDLTRFYFHANHITSEVSGHTVFAPRFTLSGLRLPVDELDDAAAADLAAVRRRPAIVELLVSPNEFSRRRIDRQVAAYDPVGDPAPSSDEERADRLFELVASRPMMLLEEVAKVEHGMARHLLRLQVLVLRYVKALLALIAAALAVFALSAVVTGRAGLSTSDEVWMAAILALWAPLTQFGIATPVRWIEGMLRSDAATHSGISDDPELSRVERLGAAITVTGWAAAAVALGFALADGSATSVGIGAAGTCVVAGGAALAVLTVGSRRP
jgi:hypothetical protein